MKKILTIILDGFGMREDIYGNAIKNAGMNNFINIWNKYPHCLLSANEEDVDLPKGQCSSSQIGHELIGAGRLIEQKINIINNVFKNDELKFKKKYIEMVSYLRTNNKNLHLFILLSDGGVSSHINHLKCFLQELEKSKIGNDIYIHAISDGRDSDRFSICKYLDEIEGLLSNNVHLSTLCGRYYALDKTKDYSRTKLYYDLIMNNKGLDGTNIRLLIEKCYDKKISDEYLPPIKAQDYIPIMNKDVCVFLNFCRESQQQFLESLCKDDFVEFNTIQTRLRIYSLFEIDKELNNNYFFERDELKHTFNEYLSELGINQARIYERIKSSEMKYYLDGERNLELKNSDIYVVETNKVDSLDEKPEMNTLSIAKTIIKCMEKDYDFIIANFANPNEVGHTGNYHATINALQAVDVCLGKIIEVAEENFYKVVIVSGHSKADTIIDRQNNIITKNTLSPVPFIIMDKKIKLKNGNISGVAPTLLEYMDIAIPKEMKQTEILLEKKQKS